MSWAGIANNQCVSFDNLKNGVDTSVFISKATQSTSLEQITKADADAKVYINTSYSPYASKSSNQLVVKSDLQPGFTVYGASYGCVVPETMILIDPTFSRSADTFDVGDVVFTKHEDTGKWGHYKVAAIERKEQPILNISTDKGGIRCSTTHLLFKEGEYIKAEQLIVGDIISHIEGDATITDIVSEGVSTVIEFNIEDAHTYVAAGFIAHNKCTVNGWGSCADACTNGVTSYGTNVYYTGAFGVGTVLNTTACFLGYPAFYYYGGGWIEIDYISLQLQVTNLGTCPCASTYVNIDYYVPYTMTCYTNYTFAANSATYTLNTSVDVEISWTGDLGGFILQTVTIPSSAQCNTVSFYSGGSINCLGENVSIVSVNLDPSAYGTQIYQVGSQYPIGSSPC